MTGKPPASCLLRRDAFDERVESALRVLEIDGQANSFQKNRKRGITETIILRLYYHKKILFPETNLAIIRRFP